MRGNCNDDVLKFALLELVALANARKRINKQLMLE